MLHLFFYKKLYKTITLPHLHSRLKYGSPFTTAVCFNARYQTPILNVDGHFARERSQSAEFTPTAAKISLR